MAASVKEERVIQNLGLAKVAHERIGGDIVRGVSGGERKRLSIGAELAHALNIMQSMRQLASTGHAVVSTPCASKYAVLRRCACLAIWRHR